MNRCGECGDPSGRLPYCLHCYAWNGMIEAINHPDGVQADRLHKALAYVRSRLPKGRGNSISMAQLLRRVRALEELLTG